jgi:hypothetical protein
MLCVLEQRYPDVIGSTLLDSVHPLVMTGTNVLHEREAWAPNAITNPPFSIATEILEHLRAIGVQNLALLVNLQFLGSLKRRPKYAADPPSFVIVFADRFVMYPKGYKGRLGSSSETYAWLVWRGPPDPARSPVLRWTTFGDYDVARLLA